MPTLWKSGCHSPSAGAASCSSLFLPNFQGFNLLWQLVVPVLISIFPLKKTKKQNAFSSKQLNHYGPISQAVIIHFIGVLLKKEKKKSSENSFCTHYFPVSCKCFANAHPPFPSPSNPPDATHPKEPVHVSQ